MQGFTRKIWLRSKQIFRSLAFLPVPMIVVGIIVGSSLYYLEQTASWNEIITDNFPSLSIQSQDTARNILSLFIGGLITLVVFTFTQLMSLFSQVAANYSPRLLPYFTGDRSLQFSMGYYLSVIILTVLVLLNIKSDNQGAVPLLSVLLCVFLGLVGLALFVYFVTTISNRIQVGGILQRVYRSGELSVLSTAKRKHYYRNAEPPRMHDWYAIPSPIDGFVGTVDYNELSKLALKYETRLYVGTAKGNYVPRNLPLLQSERELNQQQIDKVLEAIAPNSSRYYDWWWPALELLIEIFQKAMSPGINDPGTAIDTLDRMTGLLGRIFNLSDDNLYRHPDGAAVFFKRRTRRQVLRETFSRLRNYAVTDTAVMRRMIKMGHQLMAETGSDRQLLILLRAEIRSLVREANRRLENERDRALIAGEVWEARGSLRHYLIKMKFIRDPHLEQTGIQSQENPNRLRNRNDLSG